MRAITEDAHVVQNISPVARDIKLSSFVTSRTTMNEDDDSNICSKLCLEFQIDDGPALNDEKHLHHCSNPYIECWQKNLKR